MNYHWPRCRPGAQPLFTNNHLQTCRCKLFTAVLRLPRDLCRYRRGMKDLCFSSHPAPDCGTSICHSIMSYVSRAFMFDAMQSPAVIRALSHLCMVSFGFEKRQSLHCRLPQSDFTVNVLLGVRSKKISVDSLITQLSLQVESQAEQEWGATAQPFSEGNTRRKKVPQVVNKMVFDKGIRNGLCY